jgi:protein-S-isoprenylcysteine O-methyltransferase Ste14
MSSFVARGGLWVIAQTLLTVAALGAGPLLAVDAWPRLWRILGITILACGAYFGIAGVIALGTSRTVYPRPLPDAQLIRTGVYRRVRHPLYTSLMMVTAGWGLCWSSPWALVGCGALSAMLVAKAIAEEGWLRQKYPGYAEYAAEVPRFFPLIR